MANPVVAKKVKFDGTAKPDWPGDLVEAIGERWLVVYHEIAHETPWHHRRASQGIRYYGMNVPLTILASFDERGELIEYQCDASLPATLAGRTITFVDLDLDLIVAPDLSFYERDHEEFERRRVEMGYDERAVAAAREGVRLARELVATRGTPFDGHPEQVLGRTLASRGPL